ncbi:MAG TPA: hypothetical protein VH375_04530, partial [Rhodanobacteraceae bacterium]
GAIRLLPGIDAFSCGEVRFVGGRLEPFDAVVLATGYETGLDTMFDAHASPLDEVGCPPASGREAAPGLYFCGFHIVPAGLIREIAIEAVRIGELIAARQAA